MRTLQGSRLTLVSNAICNVTHGSLGATNVAGIHRNIISQFYVLTCIHLISTWLILGIYLRSHFRVLFDILLYSWDHKYVQCLLFVQKPTSNMITGYLCTKMSLNIQKTFRLIMAFVISYFIWRYCVTDPNVDRTCYKKGAHGSDRIFNPLKMLT